ncbi:uncharacterized protein LOC109704232 [Ananas comosus]|uniref:Uncharacterized protein LOC109704232 n=1 Tax=Ananas comosus TaxID=4615 RepID=A0A6P5EG59_ANACO|nr:uncharacterized protein LOC109704232 [Ananas comosus]XP_020080588.1 uncharacterized protein LOC109704232 [Ananas comosus]
MVGESKKSIVQVKKSNRASTSSQRTMECRSEKPWLRSQSKKSEPTPPLSEDPDASTHIPSTITNRSSSPTIANPDTNTTGFWVLVLCFRFDALFWGRDVYILIYKRW